MLRIDCQQKTVILQTSSTQLSIKDLEELDKEKLVNTDTAIRSFCFNCKDGFLCVLLSTNQFELYDLNTGSSIKNNFQYQQFQLFFLHLKSLWLGNISTLGKFTFSVQHLNDYEQSTCSIKLEDQPNDGYSLTDYVVNKDNLICAFRWDNINVIYHLKLLDSKQIKLLNRFKIEDTSINSVQFNEPNSQILFQCDDNLIGIIDAETIIKFSVENQLVHKSICFDLVNNDSFCVVTENHDILLMCYLPSHNQIVQIETVKNECEGTLLAYLSPNLYLQSNNQVLGHNYIELQCFQQHKDTITSLLTMNHDQFAKQLYQSDFKDKTLWSTMAKRCVLQGDIETAIFCAARMGEASLVRSLKQEMAQVDKLAALSLMALHLGLEHYSRKVLLDANSKTLCKLYQLQNKWEDAFTCADQIQIKSSYYDYARQLESENKVLDAIKYYELSGNIQEIPRMLFETGNTLDLKEYCLREDDGLVNESLVTWWGQYCESLGDTSIALEMYRKAKDYYNLVRLMCHIGQVENATRIVDQQLSSDGNMSAANTNCLTAAVLFLGKHLESVNSTESINYYLLCGAIRHAIRVCVNNELFDDLALIAVKYCSEEEARNILNTYIKQEHVINMVEPQNLVQLFYKCRHLKQAIQLAINNQLWDQLRQICDKESARDQRVLAVDKEDIDLLLQFLKNDTSIIDIVIELIMMLNENGLELITQIIQDFSINMDESVMEKVERFATSQNDTKLIGIFADLCLQKGNYQLAAKLYNKINRRAECVKALIRLGNVDKVIQFANVARDKAVYTLAANFLQTVNYQDSELIKKFYLKADAHQELERYKRALTSINHS